ncbi:MAG: hypothetical protein P1P89_21055, partial [Desulfobacterales bacterium]|nr:hypothetical protein [Desulfobacterales bacterium]
MAADICIVQGATFALFFSFSANARNIILNPATNSAIKPILLFRLILSLPLAAVAYYLSVHIAHVDAYLSVCLILRRCGEWLVEINLSEIEFKGYRKSPVYFLLVQFLTFVFALLWLLKGPFMPLLGVLIWAVLPLFITSNFISNYLLHKESVNMPWHLMLPNFGSSAITGVTVYVFRLLILLIVGKAVAGDLFTAFALGSISGSMFAFALGPSIAHYESRTGEHILPLWIKVGLFSIVITGLIIFLAAEFEFRFLSLLEKSNFFWKTAGLSLVGGGLMILAQRIRIHILQHYEGQDVFGPDLLSNLTILFIVPVSYYLVGKEALKGLFLFNAITAFLFYKSAKDGLLSKHFNVLRLNEKVLNNLIAALLIFPLFIQLSGKVFNDPSYVFVTMGVLDRVPLPVSLLGCFGGIFILGKYRRSQISLSVIFMTFVIMLCAAINSTIEQSDNEKNKILLMLQFILPMFGLVLGQMFENNNKPSLCFEKVGILVLWIIIPCQVILSLRLDRSILTPYFYFFSIHQNLQYVTVVFSCIFIISLFSLWENRGYRKLLICLGPFFGYYVVASVSMLTSFIFFAGVFVFAALQWLKNTDRWPVVLFLLVLSSAVISLHLVKNDFYFEQKYSFLSNETKNESGILIQNLEDRSDIWRYYIAGIFNDSKTFLLGHPQIPDRTLYPSAHNYYLDLVYNFGFLSVIPLLMLIVLTIKKVYSFKNKIFSHFDLIGLVLVVGFLLAIENSL